MGEILHETDWFTVAVGLQIVAGAVFVAFMWSIRRKDDD